MGPIRPSPKLLSVIVECLERIIGGAGESPKRTSQMPSTVVVNRPRPSQAYRIVKHRLSPPPAAKRPRMRGTGGSRCRQIEEILVDDKNLSTSCRRTEDLPIICQVRRDGCTYRIQVVLGNPLRSLLNRCPLLGIGLVQAERGPIGHLLQHSHYGLHVCVSRRCGSGTMAVAVARPASHGRAKHH